MKTLVSTLAGVAIALPLLAAPAYAVDPQPGEWTVKVRSTISGQPPKDTSLKNCITPEMAKNMEASFSRDPIMSRPECQKSMRRTASGFAWNFRCTGEMAVAGTGSVIFDTTTHYSGQIQMSGTIGGQPIEVVTTMDGRRTGECKPGQETKGKAKAKAKAKTKAKAKAKAPAPAPQGEPAPEQQ
jgi:hypothetical protein